MLSLALHGRFAESPLEIFKKFERFPMEGFGDHRSQPPRVLGLVPMMRDQLFQRHGLSSP
jgi:hypothetical protein